MSERKYSVGICFILHVVVFAVCMSKESLCSSPEPGLGGGGGGKSTDNIAQLAEGFDTLIEGSKIVYAPGIRSQKHIHDHTIENVAIW